MSHPAYGMNITFVNCGTCCTCGAPIWLSSNKHKLCNERNQGFYCENGHQLFFQATDLMKAQREVQDLKQQLDREKKLKEWAKQDAVNADKRATKEARRSRAYKGIVKRTKGRISNGVCPCCNRTFQNLMTHMKHEHPAYKNKSEK